MRSFELKGGIYLASSVGNSCRAWNCKIVPYHEEEDEKKKKEEVAKEDKDSGEKKPENDTNADSQGAAGASAGASTGASTGSSAGTSADDNDDKDDTDSSSEEGEDDEVVREKESSDRPHQPFVREAIGRHGDIEHLRHLLPSESETLKANYLYWMTDRTPHESLPLAEGTYRQFFRLVMSQVGLWYEEHSTPNPKGVKPDPEITKIVRGNKFSKEGVYVVGNDDDDIKHDNNDSRNRKDGDNDKRDDAKKESEEEDSDDDFDLFG